MLEFIVYISILLLITIGIYRYNSKFRILINFINIELYIYFKPIINYLQSKKIDGLIFYYGYNRNILKQKIYIADNIYIKCIQMYTDSDIEINSDYMNASIRLCLGYMEPNIIKLCKQLSKHLTMEVRKIVITYIGCDNNLYMTGFDPITGKNIYPEKSFLFNLLHYNEHDSIRVSQ